MRTWISALLISMSFSVFAEPGDIVLPDERFEAKFDRLVCESLDESGLAAPQLFSNKNIKFERMRADRMVIQFLITATFEEDGALCRYSTLLTRAPRNSLIATESKAFAVTGVSECAEGKAEIDAILKDRLPFTYTKNPIRWITLKLSSEKAVPLAKELCGADSTSFRLVFDKLPGTI